MRLPAGEHATVDNAKLVDYCLSPSHPRGRHKARLFAAALGFTLADAMKLKAALFAAARDAEAVPTRHNGFGQVYEIAFDCIGRTGAARVLSVWIALDDDPRPQLVTWYPV